MMPRSLMDSSLHGALTASTCFASIIRWRFMAVTLLVCLFVTEHWQNYSSSSLTQIHTEQFQKNITNIITVIISINGCHYYYYYCTMLGVSHQFCPPIVQVTPLKTPFGLLTLLFQSQSHVATITYNYCLHCYTLHCWLATICVDSYTLSVLTIDSWMSTTSVGAVLLTLAAGPSTVDPPALT
jgi:hypothetical protein